MLSREWGPGRQSADRREPDQQPAPWGGKPAYMMLKKDFNWDNLDD